MPAYQITTTAAQEAALAWVLARQQEADPQNAPADVGALLRALVADRLQEARRQQQRATATATDLKARIDQADPETVERVKAALGL